MEDDKIKAIFQSYQPELTSDTLFLSRLKRSMNAVELVKQHTEKSRRNNRIAVIVAALTGFVSGIIMTLFLPLINEVIASLGIYMEKFELIDMTFILQCLGWIMVGGVCVLSAINAYEITLSRLSPKARSVTH